MSSAESYVDYAREAFNEAAPIMWKTTQTMTQELRDPQTNYLHQIHADELRRIGVDGSTVAHLNCNNGRELISIIRLGAAHGTGFDISAGFVGQAQALAKAAQTPQAEFVESDIYQIDESHNGRYDMVVVTAGSLCFMPDVTAYFAVAARLLRPGGRLSVYESHPLTDTFELDRDRGDKTLTFVRSYFDKTPIKHTTGLDWINNEQYDAKPVYYFRHTLSDVFDAIREIGLVLDRFVEHGQDPSNAFQRVEAMSAKPPLSYILTTKKTG